MKVKFNFGVLDPKATRANHARTIKIVKEKITLDDILSHSEIVELEHSIYDGLLGYAFVGNAIKERKGQAEARSLSFHINHKTRGWIRSNLEYNEHPVSWDTAFYMAYYGKINTIMRGMARNIWGWL